VYAEGTLYRVDTDYLYPKMRRFLMSIELAPYMFVIDTDSYAGNFEREMCAYVTGVVGECGVGDDVALIAVEELAEMALWFDEHTVQMSDHDGCHRPTSLWPSPDGGNNSVAIFLDALPDTQLMLDRADAFVAAPPGLTGKFKLGPNKILAYRLLKLELQTTTIWEKWNPMPDENKFAKLQEIGYTIPMTCALCEFSNFPGLRAVWGTCNKHKYKHLKHTGPERGVSIHRTGCCVDLVVDPQKEVAAGLGAHSRLLTKVFR